MLDLKENLETTLTEMKGAADEYSVLINSILDWSGTQLLNKLFLFHILKCLEIEKLIILDEFLKKFRKNGSSYYILWMLDKLGLFNMAEIRYLYSKDDFGKQLEDIIFDDDYKVFTPKEAICFMKGISDYLAGKALFRGGVRSIEQIAEQISALDGFEGIYVSVKQKYIPEYDTKIIKSVNIEVHNWDEMIISDVNNALKSSKKRDKVILLINPPDNSVKYNCSRGPRKHMGIMSICSSLRDEKLVRKIAEENYPTYFNEEVPEFHIQIIDFNMVQENFSFEDFLRRLKPDMVCLTCTSIHIKAVKSLSKTVRDICGNILIGVGGIHPTVEPLGTLKDSDIDYAIIGPGEEIIIRIALELAAKEEKKLIDFSKIPNCAFMSSDNELNLSFPQEPRYTMDDYPFIAYTDQLLRKGYWSDLIVPFKSLAMLYSSQGCMHKCIYCAARPIHGSKVRFKSPEYVVREITSLMDDGVRVFMMYDDYFIASKRRVEKIADLLIKEMEIRGLSEADISLMIMTRPETIDRDVLMKLVRIGLKSISIGVETGDQVLSDFLGRQLQLEKIKEITRKVKETGVWITYFMMVGLPKQDWQSIFKSVQFINENCPSESNWAIATPYPGTDIKNKNLIRIINSDDSYPYLDMTIPHNRELDELDNLSYTETDYMTRREIFEAYYLCLKLCEQKLKPDEYEHYLDELRCRVIGDLIIKSSIDKENEKILLSIKKTDDFLTCFSKTQQLIKTLGNSIQDVYPNFKTKYLDTFIEKIQIQNGYEFLKTMEYENLIKLFFELSFIHKEYFSKTSTIRFDLKHNANDFVHTLTEITNKDVASTLEIIFSDGQSIQMADVRLTQEGDLLVIRLA
ncbi:B12-binding domain-containing radical SAM protein [Lacrimispora amygdalina]|uniref:B12-binding domain-containing radical SAM protein n=1 Tax=Lacrimispora amygdalina TaxID=253257 RepID=UPI00140B865B|nr:radical SAM protein [Lacrimispora amygdalina]